jgi:hypothetical protein
MVVFVLTIIVLIFWSVFFWWVSGLPSVLFIGIFGSLSSMFYTQAYLYFIVNEFNYTQSVEKLNKMIDQHNKNIGENEKKKAEIQAKIVSGEIFLPPAPPPELPRDDEPAQPGAGGEEVPVE